MKTIMKIFLFPVTMLIDLVTWICVGVLSCSSFVFSLTSTLLSILAFIVLVTYSVKNGLILLGLAFLVSPVGLPLLAIKIIARLQSFSLAIKRL